MWKEALQLSRDRALLPLLFVAPILQLIMFGYVVGADVRNLPTAVVDQDRTPYSRMVSDAFTGSGYFTVVARPDTESAIQPLMDSNKVGVAIIIPQRVRERCSRGTAHARRGRRRRVRLQDLTGGRRVLRRDPGPARDQAGARDAA